MTNIEMDKWIKQHEANLQFQNKGNIGQDGDEEDKNQHETEKVAIMILLLKKRNWMNGCQLLLRDNQRLCLPSSLSSAEPVFAVNDELE